MTTNERSAQDQWLEAVRHVLDESAADLDPVTTARLAAARARAVDKAAQRKGAGAWLGSGQWWLAAGASASVAATVLAIGLLVQSRLEEPLHGVEDLEVLSAAEALEFYDELEFYQWLQSQDHAS